MIAYVDSSSSALDATKLNALYFGDDGLETKLSKMLGGLMFALAFPATVPAQLLGMRFFFVDDVAIYAPRFPGFVAKNITTHDPVAAADVPAVGGVSYDHSVFTARAAAMTYVSQDDANHIVRVNGMTIASGVTSIDGSLQAHTLLLGGQLYFLQGNGAPSPERIHDYAVAEIIVEGKANDLTLPEGTVPKYRCLRLWNCNPFAITVRGQGFAITIPPLQCSTVRRDWDAAARTMKNPRYAKYFWKWETPLDPFMFQNYAHTRPGTFRDPLAVATLATTPAGAIQANNLANAALLHEFILELSKDGLHCQLVKDTTELCDLTKL